MNSNSNDTVVAVVGLGYVGLPLALAFGRTNIKTIGYRRSKDKIEELKKGFDASGEVSEEEIKSSKLLLTSEENDLSQANFFIVAVPTPVTKSNQPDMSMVENATQTVGKHLKPGGIVVYESTVYPGATEEDCVPILEQESGLKWKKDFFVGYSPERINPGDKEHSLEKVVKVVSGDTPESTKKIAEVYGTVCKAGVHVAPNIKTAEAAKVIENTQRDLNIALINELSLIFHRIGIDTNDVLAAAGTKWNFLNFKPGLVGGHCIGVDPFYLVHKAEEVGYHPQVITAGRRINDYIPEFVAEETIKGLIEAGKIIQKSKVLVMGLTFKENVKDYRNSKISVTIQKLKELGVEVFGYDPLLDEEIIKKEFSIPSVTELSDIYDAIIIATAHNEFKTMEEKIMSSTNSHPVIIDIKSVFPNLKNREGVIYKNL